ncbi:PaaX family transcriptional regulator [Pseudarthrobacter sp. NIBRBAC000502772]|uniref:PaaX family transcriptional regulator n=1 Tax=Pseudarthrobacter sp. NIBRBAC000502772 TaxID=2590775 RepID=UPI001131B272|nr:PaaX family transcriptional regulator C-terminal domain-containing protein [Pseudarthrobacter sp. NIBRBAC000502772]QDG66698.1 PaaX family transcriptional regulator [Pseudarthrobacter sp. NIBRBAC000502772]
MSTLTTAPTAPLSLLSGVHETSARAALLVALGEFVWPTGRPVWSSTLVSFLADLDYEPNAARKAIQRTVKSGHVEPVKVGRRARLEFTRAGFQSMAAGAERIYGWESRDMTWDGRWLSLLVTVPESKRQLRHHLQSGLIWAGLGSPAPGHWLSPHVDRADAVEQVIDRLGLAGQAHSFIGTHGSIGDENDLVRDAWNLDALRAQYEAFIERFAKMSPRTDRDCMVARVELVQAWRRFPYLDPDLPRQFLPRDWPGYTATKVLRERRNAWEVRSNRYWNQLENEGENSV